LKIGSLQLQRPAGIATSPLVRYLTKERKFSGIYVSMNILETTPFGLQEYWDEPQTARRAGATPCPGPALEPTDPLTRERLAHLVEALELELRQARRRVA
jgi:hypothetical protein